MNPIKQLNIIQNLLILKKRRYHLTEYNFFDLEIQFNGIINLFKMQIWNGYRKNIEMLSTTQLPNITRLLNTCNKLNIPIDIVLQKTILELI